MDQQLLNVESHCTRVPGANARSAAECLIRVPFDDILNFIIDFGCQRYKSKHKMVAQIFFVKKGAINQKK